MRVLKLSDWKVVFAAAGLVGLLLLASPTLGLALRLPAGKSFSELWVLGPGHMAEDYPFNVNADEQYVVYVGVGNHMGSAAYYMLIVKFRSQNESLPNSTDGTPSSLEPLYQQQFVIREGEAWETPLNFSVSQIQFSGNTSTVGRLTINDFVFNVDKRATYDGENFGYYFQIFIELWIYNHEAQAFQYHNRFVGLWLNVTRT